MFNGIQPQAVDPCFSQVPVKPFLGFSHNPGIGHIHVHPHQIVKVPVFRIGFRSPLFAGKAVNVPGLPAFLIPVGAGEVAVIPSEAAVLSVAAGKREF